MPYHYEKPKLWLFFWVSGLSYKYTLSVVCPSINFPSRLKNKIISHFCNKNVLSARSGIFVWNILICCNSLALVDWRFLLKFPLVTWRGIANWSHYMQKTFTSRKFFLWIFLYHFKAFLFLYSKEQSMLNFTNHLLSFCASSFLQSQANFFANEIRWVFGFSVQEVCSPQEFFQGGWS